MTNQIIKKLFKNSVIFYNLWYHIYGKRLSIRNSFFKGLTKIYVDGYPRSGNTFAITILKTIIEEKYIAHHLHTPAAIKIALRDNISTYILFRDPLNAISSYYLKKYSMVGKNELDKNFNVSLVKELIDDYNSYYSSVLKRISLIKIVHFEDIIYAPDQFLMMITKDESITQFISNDFNLDDLIKIKSSPFGATDLLGSSFPTESKELLKKDLKDLILNCRKYSTALNIYNQLLTHNKLVYLNHVSWER